MLTSAAASLGVPDTAGAFHADDKTWASDGVASHQMRCHLIWGCPPAIRWLACCNRRFLYCFELLVNPRGALLASALASHTGTS